MSRQAMQLALEALEKVITAFGSGLTLQQNAITALRQALETEQEPVAWAHNFITGNVITHTPADIGRHPERWTPLYTSPPKTEQEPVAYLHNETELLRLARRANSGDFEPSHWTPLYTAPPKHEWVGLTDDEIYDCEEEIGMPQYEISSADLYAFAQAIEAKLKEKNT